MGFSSVLYDVVDHCHTEAPEVASWSDDGLHFIIKDPNAFVKKTEKEIKYPSFVRQLNNYGFKNIRSTLEREGKHVTKGEDYFQHVMFRKGQRDLCKGIELKKTNKHKKKTAEQEKNEYKIENKRLKEQIEKLEKYKKQSGAERASKAAYSPQDQSATVIQATNANHYPHASVAVAMPEYRGQPQPFTFTTTTNLNPLPYIPPPREYEYNSPPQHVRQTVGLPPPSITPHPPPPQPHSYPYTVETHSRSHQDYQLNHLNQPPQTFVQPPDYKKLLEEIKRLTERVSSMEIKNKDMEIKIENLEMKEMNTESGDFDVDRRSENSAGMASRVISDATDASTNVATIASSLTSETATSSLFTDGLSSPPLSSIGEENSIGSFSFVDISPHPNEYPWPTDMSDILDTEEDHHGEVVKDMHAASEFALTMSSGPGDVVIGKRRRDVPSGRSVCQDSLTGKTSQGRGRKKKSRTSSTSLLTLSSVAICGVLGCIALVTSPNSLRLSSFAPSWHVHDRSFSVEKDGAMDARADGDSAHRRLTVDENLDDFEGTLGENDGSAPREDSSIKISQGMVPAVTTTTRSWVISPLELHPERWTIRHNRPWTVQNSFVLFDKSVESSGPPSLTYQEALRQQLCRVLLTTDALYPSTMGTMAVLCSPVASRMLPLPPPLPKTNSSEARDLVTRSFSSQSQTMSTPKPIINIKKNDEVPSMKPARLRGAFSGNNSLTDDLSDIIDEESNIDTTEVDPDRSSDHYYMESSPSSGFFATSLSSRSLLHPGRGQQLQNDDKTLGENKSGKENEDHTRHYGQDEDKSGGQNNTSFLFCPSAFASVSPDFFEMIGNGVSIYDNRSKNSDWNSREENVRFDGVFNDIDLDFSDFDNEDDESNVLLNNYQEEPRQVDDTPLFGVETDVLIGNSYDEEDGHNLNLKGVDHEDPNDYNSEYVDGENMSSGHSKLWIKNDRDGEREDETKALVPTFGQKGDPYGTQRSLFSDKRVAQASVIGHSNDQYSNMVILVPLSAVHGNGSGTFREGYEDIPISEQPWIELDCFINSVRIVDGIEFVSDGTIRDDHV
mmetsp:Transcript_12073/g.16135  ORF Transcript_12073/g.16135 Transcript_12073/m.16135 type:complete len:1066 (+) Transcript_12073:153-3350(+)